MERYDHQSGGMLYPQTPTDQWNEEEWFEVAGDLDDFIFYDAYRCLSEEDSGRLSRR